LNLFSEKTNNYFLDKISFNLKIGKFLFYLLYKYINNSIFYFEAWNNLF